MLEQSYAGEKEEGPPWEHTYKLAMMCNDKVNLRSFGCL